MANNDISTKELIEGVMSQNNELIKAMIPSSTSQEVDQQIESILTDLGKPAAPKQEQPGRKRYTDAQINREITNILGDLN